MKYIKSYNKIFEGLSDMEKYKNELERKNIDIYIIKRIDPSPNYKYIGMICKYALEGVHLDDIRNYIKAFDILVSKDKIQNRDIFSYKTFEELKNAVDNIEDVKTKKEILDEIKKERNVIIDNEDYLIFIPLSYEASIKYGMGAKWCISMKKDPFMWYALTNANILFYFVIIKNKKISEKLFKTYKDKLEEGWMGEQGDIKDPTNFEKFAVMSFGGDDEGGRRHKQIYTKSNHLLRTKYNKEFFADLGLPMEVFKNDLPFKEISMDDLDENVKYKELKKLKEQISFYSDGNIPNVNDYVLIKHKENNRFKKMQQLNIGDTVITPLESFINNNVGQILYITKSNKCIVTYDNIPSNIKSDFVAVNTLFTKEFKMDEIVAFSDDKSDIEAIITGNKFNL